MSCNCPTCKGRPAQTLFWCVEDEQHVGPGHKDISPGHRVIPLSPWPPRGGLPPHNPPPMLRAPGTIPAVIDFAPTLVDYGVKSPNQGLVGCCTAETGALDKALTRIKQGAYDGPYSVTFLYRAEMSVLGWTCVDQGAYEDTIGQALAQYGICKDSTLPFDPTGVTLCDPIPQSAFTEALNYLSAPAQTPIDVPQIHQALFNCQQTPLLGSVRIAYPVAMSLMQAVDNGGWVPEPPDNDSVIGGHSELFAGKNDNLQNPFGEQGMDRLFQSWGPFGDLSEGISIFNFGYDYWSSNFVQAQGGVQCYQQSDTQAGSPVNPPTDCYGQLLSDTTAALMKFLQCLATQQRNRTKVYLDPTLRTIRERR
jgi:hypothetical protein